MVEAGTLVLVKGTLVVIADLLVVGTPEGILVVVVSWQDTMDGKVGPLIAEHSMTLQLPERP